MLDKMNTSSAFDERLLLEHGKDKLGSVKDAQKVQVLYLRESVIDDITILSVCWNLKYLILHSNLITCIDPLNSCSSLFLIDLSSNKIETLPNKHFWARFVCLEILYLHGNPILEIDNIRQLSYAPKLRILTLFNTPVSLDLMYRHITVNSLWSLQALDFYLISDEEIIKYLYNRHHIAMSKHFFIQLYLTVPPTANYANIDSQIKALISLINSRIAKLSPVVIIQRYYRGFQIRKTISTELYNQLAEIKFRISRLNRAPANRRQPDLLTLPSPSNIQKLVEELKTPPTSALNTVRLPKINNQLKIDLRKLAVPLMSPSPQINIPLTVLQNSKLLQQKSSSSSSHRSHAGADISKTSRTVYSERYRMVLALQKIRQVSWRLLNTAPSSLKDIKSPLKIRDKRSSFKIPNYATTQSVSSLTDLSLDTFDGSDIPSLPFRDDLRIFSRKEPIRALNMYSEMLFSKEDGAVEIRHAKEKIRQIIKDDSDKTLNEQKLSKPAPYQSIISTTEFLGKVPPEPMSLRTIHKVLKQARGVEEKQKMKAKRQVVITRKNEEKEGTIRRTLFKEKSRDMQSHIARQNTEINEKIKDSMQTDELELRRKRVKKIRDDKLTREQKLLEDKAIADKITQLQTKTCRVLLQQKIDKRVQVSGERKRQHTLVLRNNRLLAADKVLKSAVNRCNKIHLDTALEREWLAGTLAKADAHRISHKKHQITRVNQNMKKRCVPISEELGSSHTGYLPSCRSVSPNTRMSLSRGVHIKSACNINLLLTNSN